MQRSTLRFGAAVVLGAALVAGIAGAPGLARADDGGATPRPAKAAKAGLGERELAQLNKVVTLTDDQKAQIRPIYTSAASALAAWQTANADKLAALKAQVKDANAKGDKQALKAANEALEPLIRERDKIENDAHAAALALLTPEQEAAWSTHLVAGPILARLKNVNLTDEQTAKIQSLAAEAAKQIAATSDLKDQKKARSALNKTIRDDVLTDEQRQKLDAAVGAKAGKAAMGQGAATQPAKSDVKAAGQ